MQTARFFSQSGSTRERLSGNSNMQRHIAVRSWWLLTMGSLGLGSRTDRPVRGPGRSFGLGAGMPFSALNGSGFGKIGHVVR